MSAVAPVVSRLLSSALGSRVVAVHEEEFDYATSHPMYALDIELADGRLVRALAKDTARPHPARTEARAGRSSEQLAYELLLGSANGSAPRFFGAAGSLLVLEFVEGSVLWQEGGVNAWLTVARSLRSVHSSLAEEVADFLPRYDRAWYETWLDRARKRGRRLPTAVRVHQIAVQCLLAQPQVVIHGELYPSNILVSGDRVCIVDWETVAIGPAAIDVAALASGWAETERAAIVDAYGEVDRHALLSARLHLALRWLGWSPGWTAPPEHRVDWESEAESAARHLEEAWA